MDHILTVWGWREQKRNIVDVPQQDLRNQTMERKQNMGIRQRVSLDKGYYGDGENINGNHK